MLANELEWRTGYMPLIIGGIGAMGSALFMPWVTVVSPFAGEITRTGFHLGEGRLFALALIVLALVARSEAYRPKATTRTVLLVGLAALGFAGAVEYRDLTSLVGSFTTEGAQAKLGFGVFAMGLGLTFSVTGVLKRRIDLQVSPEAGEQFVSS